MVFSLVVMYKITNTDKQLLLLDQGVWLQLTQNTG
jgi:hypothetical protein